MNERNDKQAKLGTADRRHTILIIGISRGIGRGLAAEYLQSGWFVIRTVRSSTVAPELEAMAAGMAGRLRVERLDMTRPSEIGTLRERLADDRLDVLIVNAGISDHNVPVAEIDDAEGHRITPRPRRRARDDRRNVLEAGSISLSERLTRVSTASMFQRTALSCFWSPSSSGV